MFMNLQINITITDDLPNQGNEPALRNLISSDDVAGKVCAALKEGYVDGEIHTTLNDKPIRGYWHSARTENI